MEHVSAIAKQPRSLLTLFVLGSCFQGLMPPRSVFWSLAGCGARDLCSFAHGCDELHPEVDTVNVWPRPL